MTAASYTEDLTDIATGDEASGWTNFSTNQQGSPAYQDSDYPYIQGSYAVTQTCSKSKTLGNLGYDYGSGLTLPTDGAFLIWQSFSSPFAIDDYAGTSTTYAGLHVMVGSSTSAFKQWDIGGKDKSPMPYGGWQCHAVNSTVTADNTTGSPTATLQVVGAGVALTAYPSKGEVHQVDVMRVGRCSAIFEHGTTPDSPCTIAGFAAQNDSQSNRWGLIQEVAGGYLWQGRMQLGSSTNAVDFQDSDETIFIKWTPKVTANFNTIEVLNSSSNVEMTAFTFLVLDTTTASAGRFLMTDDADVALDSCRFIDMSTFVFSVSTNTVTITDCVFTRCGQVTQGGATFSGCTFDESDAATSLLSNDPDEVSNCTFVSDGSNHAIELTTACAGNSYALDNCTFTSYATTDGSTGNEVLYNNSGGAVTITHSGTTGTISVRNGTGASTTLSSSVNVDVSVKDADGGNLEDANVTIWRATRTSYTSDTGNNAGDADFVVNEVVDTDQAGSGYLYVWNKANNYQVSIRYASWTSKTFTLPSEVTGSVTTAGSDTQLIDSAAAGWSGVDIGDPIRNTTDGSWAQVAEIVSATELKTTPLRGGAGDRTWALSDAYSINRLPITFTDNDDTVDIPLYFDRTAASGSIATYSHNFNAGAMSITIDVTARDTTPKYITQNDLQGTIGASGYSTIIKMQEDTVDV